MKLELQSNRNLSTLDFEHLEHYEPDMYHQMWKNRVRFFLANYRQVSSKKAKMRVMEELIETLENQGSGLYHVRSHEDSREIEIRLESDSDRYLIVMKFAGVDYQ